MNKEDVVYIYIYIYTHTMGYYLATVKNEIMPLAATRMELEMIMLSEVSQTNTIWYHLYVGSII